MQRSRVIRHKRQKKTPQEIEIWFQRASVQISQRISTKSAVGCFYSSLGLSSCSPRVTRSQQKQTVSGLLHRHPTFVFNSGTSNECAHSSGFALFFKDTASIPPLKSSCTSSSVQCISFDQKTMPVQMSSFLFFQFQSRCVTPLQNRDALAFLPSASILLFSFAVLGEQPRCPAANAYSHQSYRFSPDTVPSYAAVLSRAWHPGKWLARSLIGTAFWNASLTCLNISCTQPIASSHLVG